MLNCWSLFSPDWEEMTNYEQKKTITFVTYLIDARHFSTFSKLSSILVNANCKICTTASRAVKQDFGVPLTLVGSFKSDYSSCVVQVTPAHFFIIILHECNIRKLVFLWIFNSRRAWMSGRFLKKCRSPTFRCWRTNVSLCVKALKKLKG